MAKKERPQLVILEPMLPKLHGFELCSIITHDLEPKIPVVILTKFYREEQFKIESVRSFGASAFVSKPFKRPEMRELIEQVMSTEPKEKPEPELEQEQDGEEINGTAIPDAMSTNTLKELQAEEMTPTPEKEEVKVIEQENLAKDIGDSISEEKPAKPEAKKDRDFSQELDDMLEDAFSDLGLAGVEKDAPPVNGQSRTESANPVMSDSAAFESEAPAAEKKLPVPELNVEDLLSPEPKKEAPPQDDILSKIDEIAQNAFAKPKTDASSAAATKSPEEILQKAEAVTETLERELESKVKEMSAKEESRKNSRKNRKAAANQKSHTEAPETKPEPKAEKAAEEKAVPVTTEKAQPVAAKSMEEAPPKAAETPVKPDLKEVVEKEGMFSGFGPDEEEDKSSSGLVQNILSKFKKSPKKLVIPMAAAFLIVAVSAMIMIPSMTKDTPAEQAPLNSNTMEKSAPASTENDNPVKSAAVAAQDPNGTDDQAESMTQAQEPPASQPQAQPAEIPEQKPEQKPEPKSSRPPQPAPVVEDISDTQISTQLAGEMVPTQTSLNSEAPAQKPAQKNEADSGTTGGETNPGTAAADPPPAKPESEPPPPVFNTAPAKTRVGDIVSIKQVDTQPELIQQELPRFPAAAKGRGVFGTVLLNTLISENGDVLQTVAIRKIDSPFGFNEAAERAVKKWKFRPAWKDGVRVKVWKVIPIEFKENMD
ncbi:MAG: TonB family protein, partial [Deltaproteobacteria bacterium]|nr:TonB family protein [Deltaproteobacteria bacterium]